MEATRSLVPFSRLDLRNRAGAPWALNVNGPALFEEGGNTIGSNLARLGRLSVASSTQHNASRRFRQQPHHALLPLFHLRHCPRYPLRPTLRCSFFFLRARAIVAAAFWWTQSAHELARPHLAGSWAFGGPSCWVHFDLFRLCPSSRPLTSR